MAFFNSSESVDWRVRYKHGARKYGTRTLQQGTQSFTRKKKNGNKLASLAEIRSVEKETAKKVPHTSCALAFPKISIR